MTANNKEPGQKAGSYRASFPAAAQLLEQSLRRLIYVVADKHSAIVCSHIPFLKLVEAVGISQEIRSLQQLLVKRIN